MFVPDRIRSLADTGETFRRPAEFDPAGYMRGAFRVMRGGRQRRVRLRFTGLAARLVPERRWHATQTIARRKDGAVDLAMTVTGLDEVAAWVMSFGGECEVVGPEELRRRVVDGHRQGSHANRCR